MTGSIAAFKGAQLASDLVKAGLSVRPVLTANAARFVSPLTFEALTGQPVAVDIWDERPGESRMGHIELGAWANVVVIAPASAGSLARLALGLSNDLLSALCLSTASPIVLAPAMESGMWLHPATQEHTETLRRRGVTFVGPVEGRLASGDSGLGRMSEVSEIADAVELALRSGTSLAGKRVLVTAGPTREPIDPVRYLGNYSSGKMGFAVADEARARGGEVVLIAGPTEVPAPRGVTLIRVTTANQMRQAVLAHVSGVDVVVMAAAVADFTPAEFSASKVRRSGTKTLSLVATTDIAEEAVRANPLALHVGFALETQDLVPSAHEKLERKNLALVVANELSAESNPFGADDNTVVLVSRDGIRQVPSASKRLVAGQIWDEIERLLRISRHSEALG